MLFIKESSIFPEADSKACTNRCSLIEAECLPRFLHLSELWPVYWMKIDFTLCFWTILRCMSFWLYFFSFFFGFFFSILWHAKTSILESVKLLKCESVHGRGLEFVAISVCFTSFCWYVSNCIFTHSCILSSVPLLLLFHHLEAMSMEVCSSHVLYCLCLSSYVYLNMKLMCCWFDSLLLCCSENAWHKHMLSNRGFPLLALALPRCLVYAV